MLLFNWIGYRLVTQYLEVTASQKLEAKLDRNDYNESDLIEMRIALNLPYQNDQADFERVNGEVEIKGVHYNYVKRRIEGGELVVMCIPNKTKTSIENSRDSYFKLVNDLQQNGHAKKTDKSTSTAFKGLFNEYSPENNDWSIQSLNLFTGFSTGSNTSLKAAPLYLVPGQPPEYC